MGWLYFFIMNILEKIIPGIILCMRPANERRYIVTLPLIVWVHTKNDPRWLCHYGTQL